MKETIYGKAPARFDLGGGPTDVAPFQSIEGGFVVNSAVKQHAHVKITQRPDNLFTVSSADFAGAQESFRLEDEIAFDGPLRLLKAAVAYINPEQGLDITTKVDVPPGSGLGASASLSIALIGAIRRSKGEITLDPQQLVADALYIENELLDNINGGQDQYAAALGGFHAFYFRPDGKVDVKSLDVHPDTIAQLEKRSILCYTGIPHISGDVLTQIMGQYTEGNPSTVGALREMKELTRQMEIALVNGDIDEFGVLMRAIGEQQRSYHPEVYPDHVVEIMDTAKLYGAIGGKLAGAGGGGCLYLFCEDGKKEHVSQALQHGNVSLIPMEFAQNGVAVWT